MIRHRRKLSGRRLHIEHLESRDMLSVSSTLSAGTLTLTGTGAADLLQVTQSGNKWKVTGLGTTKIDGKSSESFTGVNSIEIDLGNGNNYLKISNGTVPSHLQLPQETTAIPIKSAILRSAPTSSLPIPAEPTRSPQQA